MRSALLDKIVALLDSKRERPVFLVIDGPAGAGKTTLARQILTSMGQGEVIHCDDLYNGWHDGLTPTLEHHLREWILEPLSESKMPRYRKYNWNSGNYENEIEVPVTGLLILEGVGAALKSMTDFADLSIWMEIPPTLGLERVLERDGTSIEEEMVMWIAKQGEFFAEHHNRENCSIHLPYGAPAER
ncbi:MAG: hypothetical protein RIS22_1100 [Actinomycetota bacterium]